MALRSLAGGTLFAERLGADPPSVLALHGWGRSRFDFARALQGLDALAVDLPGFGASPPPLSATGAAGYAEAVASILGEFARPPVVVGHSFGGRVAVMLAAQRPEAVRALVLVAVPLIRRASPVRSSLAYRTIRAAHRLGLVPDERMEALRRRSGSADYQAATGVMREVLVRVVGESYEEELGLVRVPVELVWGADDREVPLAVGERAEVLLAQAGVRVGLEVLPGVGHQVLLEDPEAVRRAVGRHLP